MTVDLVLADELARRAALAIDNARLYSAAQEALRAREELPVAVAHDLRTPLTSIKGNADLLRRQATAGRADPERVTDRAAAIAAAARAMSAQVADLLDAARLERVLGSLLGNTVEYRPDGGEVAVEVRREEQGDAAWACLAVRDSGVGIPGADLPRLFRRYQRAGNVVGRFPDEGIGLAGARQVVEQHGGMIAVQSAEGAGSTVTIHLPLIPRG